MTLSRARLYTHTHTHTHTERDKERPERKRVVVLSELRALRQGRTLVVRIVPGVIHALVAGRRRSPALRQESSALAPQTPRGSSTPYCDLGYRSPLRFRHHPQVPARPLAAGTLNFLPKKRIYQKGATTHLHTLEISSTAARRRAPTGGLLSS